MRTYTSSYKLLIALTICFCDSIFAKAQKDSSMINQVSSDSADQKLTMDASYNRPFLVSGKSPIAIGGYLEANTQYAQTDGISDGFSFQFRRMSIFLSSTIAKKIKFLSEIEFEDGTKEINIEYAAMDLEFHPLFNLRGGIIVNPIGSFNQNHDGPKWDFIDRPISSTTIIPATLSNAGFGLYGKHFSYGWTLGYEVFLTNGFDDKIISNEENRTSLAAGKRNLEKFEESNSGLPMFTGKLSIRNRKLGEIGISCMTGVYNKWKEDGLLLDTKRIVRVVSIDFSTSQLKNRLNITAEMASVFVEVPESYSQQFGSQQIGGFIDVVGTLVQHQLFDWENAMLNLVLRLEYADYNRETFKETGGNIADDIWSIVPGMAFRPLGTTVLRFNYRYQQHRDLLGNPPSKTGIIQFGFSSYF